MEVIRSLVRLGAFALVGLCGCAPLVEFDAPSGFARANSDWRTRHYKGRDNVGLRVSALDNVDGGTLDYWSSDLQRKLKQRGYELVKQSPIVAANQVQGKRFDFRVTPQGRGEMFLVVGLYVTDDYRYVLQLAGDEELYEAQAAAASEVFAGLRPGGCRALHSVCRTSKRSKRGLARTTALPERG